MYIAVLLLRRDTCNIVSRDLIKCRVMHDTRLTFGFEQLVNFRGGKASEEFLGKRMLFAVVSAEIPPTRAPDRAIRSSERARCT